MRQLAHFYSRLASIILVLAVLTGCTMSLVPNYDQSLIDGLNRANAETLTLFATIANGSPQGQFQTLRSRYDTLIGVFDALRLQARTRPIPMGAGRFARWGPLRAICSEDGLDITDCINSTPRKLQGIVDVLAELKRLHQTRGLGPTVVALHKTDYEQSMLAALTIEQALKR